MVTTSIIGKCQSNNVRLYQLTDAKMVTIQPSLSATQIRSVIRQTNAATLKGLLTKCKPGRSDWKFFEDICEELFCILFVPPLDYPIVQPRSAFNIIRRDLIFPNRSTSGFWDREIRSGYEGDYVLLECKNFKDPIGKEEFDQALEYLGESSVGKFGIIVTRKNVGEKIRQLQVMRWKDSKKMLIVLSDQHLHRMLDLFSNGQDPTQTIQKAIDLVRTSVV